MNIPARRAQIGMAERLLDQADWRAAVDRVGGVRVPEPVRRDSFADRSQTSVPDDPPGLRRAQMIRGVFWRREDVILMR